MTQVQGDSKNPLQAVKIRGPTNTILLKPKIRYKARDTHIGTTHVNRKVQQR